MNTAPPWLEACLQGEPSALDEIMNACQPEIFRLALCILDDEQEAQDALQETFLAAPRGIQSFRSQSSFKTWLYSIGLHICQNRLRKKRAAQKLRQILAFLFPAVPPAAPEENLVQADQHAALWQAITALDDKHRLPLLLR